MSERDTPPTRLADEVPQHRLGDVEVGDHAVAQRPDRPDRRRRPADHPARVGADGVDVAAAIVDGDDRRLEDDDPFAADEDERVRGPEIDRQLPAGE